MMKKLLIGLSVIVWASSAHAVMVSNLDEQVHVVVFEPTLDNKITQAIEPNGVIRNLQHSGTVYLQGTPNKLHVYGNDLLVIWKNGNMQIQKRRQATGRAN